MDFCRCLTAIGGSSWPQNGGRKARRLQMWLLPVKNVVLMQFVMVGAVGTGYYSSLIYFFQTFSVAVENSISPFMSLISRLKTTMKKHLLLERRCWIWPLLCVCFFPRTTVPYS